MAIEPQHIINLKGKPFVLFAGLLDAATKAGLKDAQTTVLQIPDAGNGHLAVVQAVVTFADGRCFTGTGDASPESVGPMIKPHLLRMAETRSLGRAFRMALNVATTMFEELGNAEETTAGNGSANSGVREQGGVRRDPPAAAGQSRARGSSAPVGAAAGGGGAPAGSLAAGTDAAVVAPVTHFCSDCGVEVQGVTTGKGPVSAETVVSISQSRWGATLCHTCGRKRMEVETANVPAGQIS